MPEPFFSKVTVQVATLLKQNPAKRKAPVPEPFFSKDTAQVATILNQNPAKVFSCEFAKFLRTYFLQNTSGRLLLYTRRRPLKEQCRRMKHFSAHPILKF